MRRAWAALRSVSTLAGAAAALSVGSTSLAHAQAALARGAAPASTAEVGRDLPFIPPLRLTAPPVPEGFVTLTHGWLRIVHHPSLRDSAAALERRADSMRRELATTLGQEVLDAVEVRIGRSLEEVSILAPREAPPPALAEGVAYGALHLAVLSRDADGGSDGLEELFHHELAHLALFDATAGRRVPRWLDEGFAIDSSGESAFKRMRTLWTAEVQGAMMPLAQLDSFPDTPGRSDIADAQCADFVRYLGRETERARFVSVVARLRSGEPIDRAVQESYATDLRALEQLWRDELSKQYLTLPLVVGTGAGWALAAVTLVWAFRRRRRRDAATLRRWEAEEAMEDARSALGRADRAQAARGRADGDDDGDAVCDDYVAARVPTIEHEGQVHTLH